MRARRRVGLVGALALLCLASAGTANGCPADCDTDGTVRIHELMTAVDIVLAVRPLSACPAADVNGNGTVAVDEVIIAIGAAVDGCPGSRPTLQVGDVPNALRGHDAPVDILLTNPMGPPVTAIGLELSYDPAKVGDPSCMTGPAAASAGKAVRTSQVSPDTLKITIVGGANLFDLTPIPNGIVSTCNFPIPSNAPNGSDGLIGHDLEFSTPEGNATAGNAQSGSITVVGCF